MPLKKIAYLFGAGATHAEILNLEESPSATFIQRNGLLISDVSKRVMGEAQNIPGFKKDVESVTSPEGSLNIELLISLFTSNQIPHSDYKVNKLKKLVRNDILKRLSPRRKRRFYLHKALLELHKSIDDRENLLGIISLNYDDILDEAYRACQMDIKYCHTSADGGHGCSPLLKLHGSFNWTRRNNYGKRKDIPIIPLGLNKNYLVPPYNFIWSRAFEILTQCDTLRLIGCSLNQNDVGLIDLLFKAHLERTRYFEIEIIDWQDKGVEIKSNYGFFPGIIKPKDIEDSLMANEQIYETGIGNPFKIWLKVKAQKMLQTMDEIKKTKYLIKCFEFIKGKGKTMTTKETILKGNRTLLNIPVKKFIDDYVYRIDLDADYQREKIWTTGQQEKLLDSILRDIDIPKIYIVETNGNKQFDYECIDGKQRMTALLRFFKPDPNEESPLMVRHYEKKYTYKEFKKTNPTDAKKIEDYPLSFTIYKPLDDEYVREIFRRLQLGIRLNSGELLKTRTGTIRDFVYKDISKGGPFFRNTKLSEKRFSREFTLAQICVNSFARAKPEGEFVRARLLDIEDFFEDNHDLDKKDENLVRIGKVLREMDKAFKKDAFIISSRAVAVTAYLFVEELIVNNKINLTADFAKFYVKLLNEIQHNMDLLSKYNKPKNSTVMEGFQKYILQASVEGYSIQRRHNFLKKAFDYYLSPETKGKIIGDK